MPRVLFVTEQQLVVTKHHQLESVSSSYILGSLTLLSCVVA